MQQTVAELAEYLTRSYLRPSPSSSTTSLIESHAAGAAVVAAARSSGALDERRQVWICIAGGPGSGKSTLAAQLVALLNAQAQEKSQLIDSRAADVAVCLPMDGFHYRYVRRSCSYCAYTCMHVCKPNTCVQPVKSTSSKSLPLQ